MPDLTVVAFVSRPEIPPNTDLNIENPGTYRIVSINPGPLIWVRNEVSAPYVHGRVLVNAIKDNPITEIVIRTYGASAAAVESNLAALLRAFEQFRYRLGITIDGVAHEWYCQPAEYAPANDDWSKFELIARHQTYRFVIPREPTPIAGAH